MLANEVETKLKAVLKSLSDTPRNAYEADNLYRLNCERIAAARAALADMSGEYVDQLRGRCNEAEKQAMLKHAAEVAGTAAVENVFSLDFEMEEAEEENAAELELAKAAAGANKRSTKKGGANIKSKKSKSRAFKECTQRGKDEGEAEAAKDNRTLGNPPLSLHTANQPKDTAVEAAVSSPPAQSRWAIYDRQDDLVSTELPVVLTTSDRGACEPVSNSPHARVFFHAEMEVGDGTVCRCAVELYRCVVIALTYGEPQLSWEECQTALQEQLAAGVSTGKGSVSKRTPVPDTAGPAPTAGNQGEVSGDEEGQDNEDKELEDDLTLSEQLIAEYEQVQRAEAELDLDTSTLPREVTEKLQRRLRTFTDEVWVVLLCHGGYFAGGAFVRGVCVVHKAFQRYVVRKKQGGKQSSNAKDAGSYNSVGSQIRAAQEVKWRADVRDILLEWTPYIKAASFILYAAPGPQNRAVLTDFSLLPAVAGLGGVKGVSPIQLRDRRVNRVPITTHRPNFEEVQRIYKVCSHCSLLYVRDEKAG